MSKVIVIGGGIAGLSAAHHLLRGGVDEIHVYEPSDRVGGKAKNQSVAGERGGSYPAEHGFRFFPHFYRHVVDTMRSTPVGAGTAWDQLVASQDAGVAFDQQLLRIARPAHLSDAPRFLRSIVDMLSIPGIGMEDALRYARVLLQFATSCRDRRNEEYDRRSWAEFAHSDKYTARFHELVILASRNLSAMRAPESSAATIGATTLQMIFDFEPTPDRKMDPMLHGPTDETWLQPWFTHLRNQQIQFHFGEKLEGFDFDSGTGALAGVRIGGHTVTASHYLCAIPLDCIVPLLSDAMCAHDPALANLRLLAPRACGNMIGVQYFLRSDMPIVTGHVHFPQSAFAMTAISQAQFWQPPPQLRPGTPELMGVLSAIISDWDTPGSEKRKACDYADRDALLRETWRQMATSLPPGTLREQDIIAMHLDANVGLAPFKNPTPLLIHPLGQRAQRPEARTGIANLYLASDFVRTNTDLATMEGADEAARRAVQALLDSAGVASSKWPTVWEFSEGPLFDTGKHLDQVFFRLGLKHPMEESAERVEEVKHSLAGQLLFNAAITMVDKLAGKVDLPHFDWSNPDHDLLEKWAKRLAGN
jgi:uncharacterized protein with NAD-binding domain and iron-sulfur cluster